jgi:molecular chaperone GrpE
VTAREAEGDEVIEHVEDAEVVETTAAEDAAVVEADLDELSATRKERDEYLDLAQRTKADFENFRKRSAREAEEALVRGRAQLAARLIPAIDNLERALTAADGADATLLKGIGMVQSDIAEALKAAGVEAYDPHGERFDPAWHEALSTVKAEGTEPGTVIETLARGYRLGDQALRPARVVVSE